MKVLPISKKIKTYLAKHQIEKKFAKQISLFEENPKHPGLNTELLEPKRYRIYSFRVDQRFRALFIFRDDLRAIEIISVTLHYV